MNRIYMSEIAPFWTFARQEEKLAALLPGAMVFKDALTRRERQGHSTANLLQRELLVRPTTREVIDETVYVASLAVLAWSADDLMHFVEALTQRGAKLVSVDDGPWDDLLSAWHFARTKARLSGASLQGGAVTKQKMAELYGPRVERIRERWGNPAYDTADLLKEAGVSRNTANKYLGIKREAAFLREEARLKRKARDTGS